MTLNSMSTVIAGLFHAGVSDAMHYICIFRSKYGEVEHALDRRLSVNADDVLQAIAALEEQMTIESERLTRIIAVVPDHLAKIS